MKKKIETEITITIKIEDNEFYLTKAEAEDLYNSLKSSLGGSDPIIFPSHKDLNKKYKE